MNDWRPIAEYEGVMAQVILWVDWRQTGPTGRKLGHVAIGYIEEIAAQYCTSRFLAILRHVPGDLPGDVRAQFQPDYTQYIWCDAVTGKPLENHGRRVTHFYEMVGPP